MSREGAYARGGMQGYLPIRGADQQRGFTRDKEWRINPRAPLDADDPPTPAG